MRNWYVVTGAPSSGKTTLLRELDSRGFHTEEEVARVYIDRQMKAGHSIEKIRADEEGFQSRVLRLKVELEEKLPKERLIFFDRGLPDTLAYYWLHGFTIPNVMVEEIKTAEYKKVFILEPLSIYEKDYSRTENKEEALKLHDLLRKAYTEISAEIVVIPSMPKEERLVRVMRELEEEKK